MRWKKKNLIFFRRPASSFSLVILVFFVVIILSPVYEFRFYIIYFIPSLTISGRTFYTRSNNKNSELYYIKYKYYDDSIKILYTHTGTYIAKDDIMISTCKISASLLNSPVLLGLSTRFPSVRFHIYYILSDQKFLFFFAIFSGSSLTTNGFRVPPSHSPRILTRWSPSERL